MPKSEIRDELDVCIFYLFSKIFMILDLSVPFGTEQY